MKKKIATCDGGKDIKILKCPGIKDSHKPDSWSKEQWKRYVLMVDEQWTIQKNAGIDECVTLSISPTYRQSYCLGFDIAKRLMIEILTP